MVDSSWCVIEITIKTIIL